MNDLCNVANCGLGFAELNNLFDEVIIEGAIEDADVLMSAQCGQKRVKRALLVISVSKKNQIRRSSLRFEMLGECQKPAGLRLSFF